MPHTFTSVTDIQTLVDRQTVSNAELIAPLEALKLSHEDVDFTIYPRIANPEPDDDGCPGCGCATVGVKSPRTRKIVRVCRDVISALKLASVIQDNPLEIRTYCRIRYIDDLPIKSSQSMTLHEATRQINAGLMQVDNEESLIIHDLIHTDDQHCPGVNCTSKRHPECPQDVEEVKCPDFVQVPPREP